MMRTRIFRTRDAGTFVCDIRKEIRTEIRRKLW